LSTGVRKFDIVVEIEDPDYVPPVEQDLSATKVYLQFAQQVFENTLNT
jgi:hypothetical protein